MKRLRSNSLGVATGAMLLGWMLAGHGLAVTAAPKPAAKQPSPARAGASRPSPAKATRSPAPPPRNIREVATAARTFEDAGAYALAAAELRELRRRVQPDADLELALALDEARIGLLDSAWVRLHSPILKAALADTAGTTRRTEYPFSREPMWVNGRFDGWYWYVARARAELALQRRDWPAAFTASQIAVSAREYSGTDLLMLGLCAARAGELDVAQTACAQAIAFEPGLPEARYLQGLLHWRSGRRLEAQVQFKLAVAQDSSYRAPALAMTRLLLPSSRPDSLPAVLLTGARRCAMITSSQRPKPEEFIQMDTGTGIYANPMPALPDTLRQQLALKKPLQIVVQVLVSEAGLPLLINLPYISHAAVPPGVVNHMATALQQWRFRAPLRLGKPQMGWASIEYTLEP